LKYHAEGPASYDKAAIAYKELFKSEIFSYPESLSEFRRWETLPEYNELFQQNFDSTAQTLMPSSESAPNTLPQILHLSYKCHGQFILDLLHHRVQEFVRNAHQHGPRPDANTRAANVPLNLFAEALDKDDTDLDLWRRSARVALWAGSYRIVRFCLEAVLDGDIDGLDTVFDSPGIDERIATHLLQQMADQLHDDLSILVSPLDSRRRKSLSATLKKLLDPYPLFNDKPFGSAALSMTGNIGQTPDSYLITVASRDWNAVGHIVLQQLALEEQGELSKLCPGFGMGLKIPPPSSKCAKLHPIKPKDETRSPLPNETLDAVPEERHPSPKADNQEVQRSHEVTDTQDKQQAHDGAKKDDDGSRPQEPAASNPQSRGETEAPEDAQPPRVSRKRSSESAGLSEVADGARGRSKRIRARWNTSGERIDTAPADATKHTIGSEQLELYHEADKKLGELIDSILTKLDIAHHFSLGAVRDVVRDDHNELNSHPKSSGVYTAVRDLFDLVKLCEPRSIEALQNYSFNDKLGVASRQAGLSVFLGHETNGSTTAVAKPALVLDHGLDEWVRKLNSSWCSSKEAAWLWICEMVRPKHTRDSSTSANTPSLYTSYVWPDELRHTVRQIAVKSDVFIFDNAEAELSAAQDRWLSETAEQRAFQLTASEQSVIEMIQTMFEIHVDEYAVLKTASTSGSEMACIAQRDRLDHWSMLANAAIQLGLHKGQQSSQRDLAVRHIWAQSNYISLGENVSQHHILACLKDLKTLMRSFGRVIELPNNETMTELSIEAAEAKLRRMSMKDFFLRIFGDEVDNDDGALAVIEGVEPMLEQAEAFLRRNRTEEAVEPGSSIESPASTPSVDRMETSATGQPSHLDEIARFIATSSLTLRLALWRRLRDAYNALLLRSMVVYCDFRTIDILVAELQSPNYTGLTSSQRQPKLLKWICLIDDLINKTLQMRNEVPDFLECIDAEQIKRSMGSLTSLCCILQSARLVEDQVSVGHVQTPRPSNRGFAAFSSLSNRINDMILRAWTLQYHLLKDCIDQYQESFSAPAEDRLNFLTRVHHSMGIRGNCTAAKRIFLKLARDELLTLSDLWESGAELCQVLYDLYGLKCAQYPGEIAEHDCGHNEILTKKEALKLVGFMMVQAAKSPVKDLPKTELKAAIDKVHEALGRPKPSDSLQLNKRLCNSFIKGPMNPLNFYSCLKGNLCLSAKRISPAEAPVAAKGWYFLQGNISLHKFRMQKRVSAGPTDDLDAAAQFFLQDLEYSCDQWETWYRLGQTHEAQLEECISWSAEKINGTSNEITTYQRQAINCYAMAVSCAVRAGAGEELSHVSKRVGELYSDFGNCLYASSREPFSMKAFQVRESEEKIYNRSAPHAGGPLTYKAPAFRPLRPYYAWKISATLFREAIRLTPEKWM
jgi:hypothetical protein